MKSIEVSEEVYDQLVSIAKEMSEQDPRGTRMPHIFQIRDWKKVYDWGLNGETHIWISESNQESEIETLEHLKDYLEDHQIEYNEAELTSLWNGDHYFGLTDWVEENCPDLKECSYSIEPFYVNSFLTAKAAENHLKLNYYHYHPNADVYLNHAWRNPESEVITKFLLGIIGKDIYT